MPTRQGPEDQDEGSGEAVGSSGPERGRKFRTAEVSVRQEGPCTQLLTAEQQGLSEFQLLTPEPHTPAYRALQSFLNSRARILLSKDTRKHDDKPHHSEVA